MSENFVTKPSVLQRYFTGPLADERLRYLEHLSKEGHLISRFILQSAIGSRAHVPPKICKGL